MTAKPVSSVLPPRQSRPDLRTEQPHGLPFGTRGWSAAWSFPAAQPYRTWVDWPSSTRAPAARAWAASPSSVEDGGGSGRSDTRSTGW